MGSLFHRKGSAVFCMTFWDPVAKKWVQRSSGTKKESEAKRILADMEAVQRRRAAAANVELGPLGEAPPNRPARRGTKQLVLADAVEQWITERAAAARANHDNEVAHLRNHLLPVLGAMVLVSLRPKHIRAWLRELEKKPPVKGKRETIAPRTVRKIYGTIHKVFEDFVVDELIVSSPCKIKPEDLPPDVDSDPEWRESAIYSTDEIELLISDPGIPEHRRMFYAISFLTGSRHGEVAALRFRHIDVGTQTLQRIMIARSYGGRTKTKVTKRVPVHPTLAAMLAEWKLGGYHRWVGRPWAPNDLIIPGPVPRLRNELRGDPDRMQSRHVAYKRLVDVDLPRLGLRHRRMHDMRHGFITLATESGAKYEDVKLITHAPPRGAFDRYVRVGWQRLCEAVMCIKVGRRGGKIGTG